MWQGCSPLENACVLFSRSKVSFSCKAHWATVMSHCAHTKRGEQPCCALTCCATHVRQRARPVCYNRTSLGRVCDPPVIDPISPTTTIALALVYWHQFPAVWQIPTVRRRNLREKPAGHVSWPGGMCVCPTGNGKGTCARGVSPGS